MNLTLVRLIIGFDGFKAVTLWVVVVGNCELVRCAKWTKRSSPIINNVGLVVAFVANDFNELHALIYCGPLV